MGHKFTDSYSLLHFAVGIISYFWGISFIMIILFHTLFEILENTKSGMYFINTYFTMWPGGKSHADSILNRIGDTFYTGIGWIIAYLIDKK